MREYIGAKYIGVDPIHLNDGSVIMNDEMTELLTEEAALNDNNFEPVYENVKQKITEISRDEIIMKQDVKRKYKRGGRK